MNRWLSSEILCTRQLQLLTRRCLSSWLSYAGFIEDTQLMKALHLRPMSRSC